MKNVALKKLIRETIFKLFEEEASDTAHRLNLDSDGWGYWTDKAGDRVAQSVKGPDGKMHLVRLSANDKQALQQKPQDDPYSAPTDQPKINLKKADTEYDPYDPKNKPALGGDRAQKVQAREIFSDPVYKKRIPGTIVPPKGKNGGPIEVSVNGKPGLVDAFNKEEGVALITFDDGTFGEFKISELKPLKSNSLG